MNIYTFHCPDCSHTFRRILSDPSKATVACPLCGAAAARDDSAGRPPSSPPAITQRGEPAGAEARVAVACADSADGDDP